MILDSMNKFEVMRAIRKDFDEDVLPFYNSSLRLKIRLMIKDRASRLKSVINLGWTEYISRNKIKYHILQKGDQYGDTPLFISECIWKKRNGKPQTIFATLHPNSAIAIYTQHCLERYAERVIFQPSRPLKDILNDLLKQQKFAFHIVLPSPTHKFTVYHSFANALFLGDYDPPKDSNSPSWNWYNTCISLNESGESQSIILSKLTKLQEFVNNYKFDPIDNHNHFQQFIKKQIISINDKNRLIEFLQIRFTLLQLHLSYDLPFTHIFNQHINAEIEIIRSQLKYLGANIDDNTIFKDISSIKDELNYNGK